MHETNTFAPGKTTLKDFQESDAWPGLTTGEAILPAIDGVNLACTGFVDEINARADHEIVPLLWCAANPSGLVCDETFNIISNHIIELITAKQPDAIYLDLHGAMVAEGYSDGEGELLNRIREQVGSSIPIVATLDFHANVTEAMVAASDCLVAYREYPHVDMADTGRRAAVIMQRILAGEQFYASWHKCDFILPLTGQCTAEGSPAAEIMQFAQSLQSDNCPLVQFVPGFPLSDTAHTGPAVISYATELEQAQKSTELLSEKVNNNKYNLIEPLYEPDDAIALLVPGQRTIFADTQDNPGGGGSGDTTGMLHALRNAQVQNVCVGIICDPNFAAQAHKAGVGKTIYAELGALTLTSEQPFSGQFYIKNLGNGELTGTGPFYAGCRMELGLMACVSIDGIDIVVSSRKQQAADQAMFYHVGANPLEYDLLVLKSSVHFRADFSRIADKILVVKSPGANTADLRDLDYKNLPENVRVVS